MEGKGKGFRRLEVTKEVGPAVDAYYERLLHASEEGRLVGWTFGQAPNAQLLTSQGIGLVGLGPIAARNAARGGIAQVIPAAEAWGCSPELCSYGKIAIGTASLIAEGRLNEIQDNCRLPRADFCVICTGCPVFSYIGHNVARIFNVPVFVVDVPCSYDSVLTGGATGTGPEWEKNRAYILSQLKDMIPFLEGMMGHKYDWETLRRYHENMRKAASLREEIMTLYGRAQPSPISFFDMLIMMAMLTGPLRGTDGSIGFYERALKEVEQRVKQGIGNVENERYRFYWHDIAVWFKVGHLSKLFAAYGATIAGGTYPMGQYCKAERIDPDQPLWTVAEENLWMRWDNHPAGFEVDRMLEQMSTIAPLHGVVYHSPRTCREMAVHMLQKAEIMEEKTGLPGLVLDIDQCDPQYYVDSQVELRVQAFIESLAGRKPWNPN